MRHRGELGKIYTYEYEVAKAEGSVVTLRITDSGGSIVGEGTGDTVCTAPGSLDTHLCYAAWRSSYSSRASIGV